MPDSQEPKTINTAGAGEEESLSLTDSPSPAIQPKNDAKQYGVLKCYFHTPKRGDIWGAFCFLFDGRTGESLENVFWVTRSLVGPAIDVNAQWRTLNKLIPQMGTYEKFLGDKLSILLVEVFPSGIRAELCQSDDVQEQLKVISAEIRNSFERATHCFLEFQMAFEHMTEEELAHSGVLQKESGPAAPGTDKTDAGEKSFIGTLINCLPVIDPVHGKAVSDLQNGDMVEVKIQGGVGAGELIYKFLESTSQDAVFPIESIERTDSEKTYIFLKVSDEVKGLITVTKDLRLRVLDIKGAKKTSVTINMDNVVLFGVFAAATVVIAFVARYFFRSV